MVSAIEFMNLLIDGAMPVDARKKPKSTATIAGPGLMEPPRIRTTRMIANISTTDSEMATTDSHPWSVRLAGPERCGRALLRPVHRATNSPVVAAR